MRIGSVDVQMKTEFGDWQPLSSPRRNVDLVKRWRVLLEDPLNRPFTTGEAVMQPYERLIWEMWMPPIRRTFACAILNTTFH